MPDVSDVVTWPVFPTGLSRPAPEFLSPFPPEGIRSILPGVAPLFLVCRDRVIAAAVSDGQASASRDRGSQEPRLQVRLDVSQPDASHQFVTFSGTLGLACVQPLLAAQPWTEIDRRLSCATLGSGNRWAAPLPCRKWRSSTTSAQGQQESNGPRERASGLPGQAAPPSEESTMSRAPPRDIVTWGLGRVPIGGTTQCTNYVCWRGGNQTRTNVGQTLLMEAF
jgi:hypothetical protein